MTRSIPSRGNIPRNLRGKKQVGLKNKSGNSVTRGIDVNIGTIARGRQITRGSKAASEPYPIEGKPVNQEGPGKERLEKLLDWGRQEERRCTKLLRMLPSELPEYNEVLERLNKLQDVLEQVKRQLTVRR